MQEFNPEKLDFVEEGIADLLKKQDSTFSLGLQSRLELGKYDTENYIEDSFDEDVIQ